jgi:hypothetical protein
MYWAEIDPQSAGHRQPPAYLYLAIRPGGACTARKASMLARRPSVPFPILPLVLLILALAAGCGDDTPMESAATRPESFTFFEMGVNTVLTETLRDGLTQRLGSAAVSRRGLMDLTFADKAFLGRHLPELDRLNHDLNPPSGERREHDILSLMYRYPEKKNPSFEDVRLVFSGRLRIPLAFQIVANRAGSEIIAALQEKYGRPGASGTREETGDNYRLWRRNKDVLVVLQTKDRFGEPEYHIAFYFTENIADLVLAEKQAAAKAEQARRKAGKSAF